MQAWNRPFARSPSGCWIRSIEAGGGEVCSEFTRKLPGHVFAEFFHLSPELSMSIKETSVIYNQALQEANDDLVKETSLRLYELARLIIEMRKAEPWDPARGSHQRSAPGARQRRRAFAGEPGAGNHSPDDRGWNDRA